jgi:molybdenum cofactor biosynthesis protein B
MASRNERDFVPVNIAILTVSDTRTLETDKSGRTLQELAEADGHKVVAREIVEDSAEAIAGRLRAWIAEPEVDVVLSTGGTGLTGRDVTPEAFKAVMEKTIGTSTMQSRAIGGLAEGTYLFALPGSPGACRDGWREILSAQLDYRSKPCNLVELMPRLRER